MVLFISIAPASAATQTYITGVKDKTVHQGDKLTINAQVHYKGPAGRERNLFRSDQDTLHIYIKGSNGVVLFEDHSNRLRFDDVSVDIPNSNQEIILSI